jgi:hypothetical protein
VGGDRIDAADPHTAEVPDALVAMNAISSRPATGWDDWNRSPFRPLAFRRRERELCRTRTQRRRAKPEPPHGAGDGKDRDDRHRRGHLSRRPRGDRRRHEVATLTSSRSALASAISRRRRFGSSRAALQQAANPGRRGWQRRPVGIALEDLASASAVVAVDARRPASSS